MTTPKEIILERTKTGSRLIIFDIDNETGARSVDDIVEAGNDYLVVRCVAHKLRDIRDMDGLVLVGPDGTKKPATQCRSLDAFVKQTVAELVPYPYG